VGNSGGQQLASAEDVSIANVVVLGLKACVKF
jgi:hypothetical protein